MEKSWSLHLESLVSKDVERLRFNTLNSGAPVQTSTADHPGGRQQVRDHPQGYRGAGLQRFRNAFKPLPAQ